MQYSPFNAKGIPKLKNRRSSFEKSGWLPFIIRQIEFVATGTLIQGVALDRNTQHYFGAKVDIRVDLTRPVYFRETQNGNTQIELNYFPTNEVEPVSTLLYDDCRNEIEVLLKSST